MENNNLNLAGRGMYNQFQNQSDQQMNLDADSFQPKSNNRPRKHIEQQNEDFDETVEQNTFQKKKRDKNDRQDRQSHPVTFCALIRHGERADNVDYVSLGIDIEEKQDPPLTPLGVQQAQETGLFLQKYLLQNNYTNVIIESSPYLRSLQTANETAKIMNIKSVKINYLLGEWMKGKFFTSNPLDTLLIRNKQQYVQNHYLDGLNVIDVDITKKSQDSKDYFAVYDNFPEEYYEAGQRTKQVQNQLYWNSRKQKYSKTEKTAILNFSHGAIVNQYTEICDYNRKLVKSCGYCAITAMLVKNKKTSLEFKVHEKHLSGGHVDNSLQSKIDMSKLTEEEKLEAALGYIPAPKSQSQNDEQQQKVDETKIYNLMNMGFTYDQCKNALQKCAGDQEKAVNFLLDQ